MKKGRKGEKGEKRENVRLENSLRITEKNICQKYMAEVELQNWKDRVLRAKMLAMYDMKLDPLSNPAHLNTRVKGKLLDEIDKLLKKPDEELTQEFNEWCNDEYFKKKNIDALPVKISTPVHLPPDLQEILDQRIAESEAKELVSEV